MLRAPCTAPCLLCLLSLLPPSSPGSDLHLLRPSQTIPMGLLPTFSPRSAGEQDCFSASQCWTRYTSILRADSILIKAFMTMIHLSFHSIRQLQGSDWRSHRTPSPRLPAGEGRASTDYFIKKQGRIFPFFFQALPRLLPTLFKTLL